MSLCNMKKAAKRRYYSAKVSVFKLVCFILRVFMRIMILGVHIFL